MHVHTQSHSQTKDQSHWSECETSRQVKLQVGQRQYVRLAQCFPVVVGKVYEHYVVRCCIQLPKYSLLTALGHIKLISCFWSYKSLKVAVKSLGGG